MVINRLGLTDLGASRFSTLGAEKRASGFRFIVSGVEDAADQTVLAVKADGSIAWSSEQAAAATDSFPVCIDNDRNVYAHCETGADSHRFTKYSATGTRIWDYDLSSDSRDCTVMTVDNDGQLHYFMKAGDRDASNALYKLNAAGTSTLWSWTATGDPEIEDVVVDDDGNVYVGTKWFDGYTSVTLWKLDSSSATIWSKLPGGLMTIGWLGITTAGAVTAVVVDADHNVYAGHPTWADDEEDVPDSLTKYNSSGTVTASTLVATYDYFGFGYVGAEPYIMRLDASGNIYGLHQGVTTPTQYDTVRYTSGLSLSWRVYSVHPIQSGFPWPLMDVTGAHLYNNLNAGDTRIEQRLQSTGAHVTDFDFDIPFRVRGFAASARTPLAT